MHGTDPERTRSPKSGMVLAHLGWLVDARPLSWLSPWVGQSGVCLMRSGRERAAGRFGLADLEPGDVLAGGGGDFGEQFVAVVDPPGGIGGFDGDGAPGVDHADVDALPGDGQ